MLCVCVIRMECSDEEGVDYEDGQEDESSEGVSVWCREREREEMLSPLVMRCTMTKWEAD